MSQTFTMPNSHSPLKALFLSFVLHSFLISSCIFIFKPSHMSFKPEFLFLGSILENLDIYSVPVKLNSSPGHSTQPSLIITTSDQRPSSLTEPSKPSTNPLFSNKKYIDKSLFYSDQPDPLKHTLETEDLNFNLKLPPYTPLKYETHDKN